MSETKRPYKRPVVTSTGFIPEKSILDNGLEVLEKSNDGPLSFAVKHAMGSVQKKKTVPRLAFTEDVYNNTQFGGIFRTKSSLLPDYLKKQIRTQNSLVASILRTRSNQLALNGHIRRDRFDVGVEIMLKPEFASIIKAEQMPKIKDRISKAEKVLINCGSNQGLERDERMSLSRFLGVQASNGLTFGWFGTEIIWERDSQNGHKVFNRFRPVDSGTIFYPTRRDDKEHESIRRSALSALKELKHIKLDLNLDALEDDQYTFIQVVNGIPRQAFTDDELIMTKLFDNTDLELNKYPIGPMESAITAITTHLSIGTYNKLFFQNGRAAKGMLVVKSTEIDQSAVDNMKNEFFSSINGVNNAFRVPIFAIDPEDDVHWENMTSATGEGEYQFLYDQVARDILASFGMSPDELPGFGHLCLNPNTKVWTDKGFFSIGEILNGQQEVGGFKVWTGTQFTKARAFVTGKRKQCSVITGNGITINSSPDHLFRTINQKGELDWIKQENLRAGDTILVNARETIGHASFIPEYNGKKLTVDQETYGRLSLLPL